VAREGSGEVKPSIAIVRKACEQAGARQAVLVLFDGSGNMAVVSYGETKKECAAVRVTCDAIADALESGELPAPR